MDSNKLVGGIAGALGGTYKYIALQINSIDVSIMDKVEKLGEAGLTALVCGVLGIIGKDIYQFIKSEFKICYQKIKSMRNKK